MLPVVLRWGLALGLATSLGALLHTAGLRGLDDPARAQRLLLWHGHPCVATEVKRTHEDELAVTCNGDRIRFGQQPSCDERFACEMLGLDVMCWDVLR